MNKYSINHTNILTHIDENSDDKEYKKLFLELESLIKLIKKNNVSLPELVNYSIPHFWKHYNSRESTSRFVKYFSKISACDWKKEHLFNLKFTFGMLRYDELASDDEYISLMNTLHTLTKPQIENILILKNNHLFKDLKVGLLSSDLGHHPVGKFILALLKNKLNYESIQYYAYDTKGRNDSIQQEISIITSKFYNVSEYNDEDLSDLILKDELDILIDLNGLSDNSKIDIMTSRLAPVQMSYIGFPGTTGYYNIDYTIVDRITDPLEFSQKFYTEKLLYLSKTFLCCTKEPPESIISYIPPYKQNGYVTIGSFVNLHKYSDRLLRLWKVIMDNAPNVHFFIQSFLLKTDKDIELQKQRFSSFGLDINRIDFNLQGNLYEYYSNYNKVDFVLDTFPFNGATTTCDAFSMSVPVITLTGHTHVSRVTASMLINMELPELIAYSDEEYVHKALELINNVEQLSILRKIIREKFMHSPLTDTLSFKLELEQKLRDVYIQYVIDNKFNRTPDSTDTYLLAKEALTSMFYIQNLISETTLEYCEIPPLILKEFIYVHRILSRLLQTSNIENMEALSILKRYDNLLKLLSKTTDKKTLVILIDSIKKIISMFIR